MVRAPRLGLVSIGVFTALLASQTAFAQTRLNVPYTINDYSRLTGSDDPAVANMVSFVGSSGVYSFPVGEFSGADERIVGRLSISVTVPLGSGWRVYAFPLTMTINGTLHNVNETITVMQDASNDGAWLFWSGLATWDVGNGMTVGFQFNTNATGQANAGETRTTNVIGQFYAYPTPVAPPLPPAALLDDFNRANGGIGSNWLGSRSGFGVRDASVEVFNGGPIYWYQNGSGLFGIDQEAEVALTSVNGAATEQDLLLKVQSNPTPNYRLGEIEVIYDALHQSVRVETVLPNATAWTQYASTSVTFFDGDRLRGRALSSGVVEIYQNDKVVSRTTLSASDQTFFNGRGGYIGVWFDNAYTARFDDFSGGTFVPTAR